MVRHLTWDDGQPPELRAPVLLMSLDGFIDAGSAGETAATFLRHRWKAERIGELDGDAFLDFRARRPLADIAAGILRGVDFPRIELFAATRADEGRDIVLLLGDEPDMRWTAFCATLVEAAQALDVRAAIALGAYPAAVPHTRPVRVTRALAGPDGPLTVPGTDVPGYTGPIGATIAAQTALAEIGLQAAGLWAEVPHYISANSNPAGALALVRAVATALGETIDTSELEAAAKDHRDQVDAAVREHEDARAMIAAFERQVDSGSAMEGELTMKSGDELAEEIESFLRTDREG